MDCVSSTQTNTYRTDIIVFYREFVCYLKNYSYLRSTKMYKFQEFSEMQH